MKLEAGTEAKPMKKHCLLAYTQFVLIYHSVASAKGDMLPGSWVLSDQLANRQPDRKKLFFFF